MLSKLSLLSLPAKPAFSSFDFVDWTSDGVYIDEQLFFPNISRNGANSSCNTALISFSGLQNDRAWKNVEKTQGEGKKIIWDLSSYVASLLLEKEKEPLEAVFHYVSSKLEELLPYLAKNLPLAVCLTTFSPENPPVFSDEQELYRDSLKQRAAPLELFRYELFLHFIEQLSPLFSGIAVFAAVDFSTSPISTSLLLSSKEYFERIHLFSLNFSSPGAFLREEGEAIFTHFADREERATAILLPASEWGLWQELSLSHVASSLLEKGISYKVIAEPFLHLEWAGLQQLVVFSSYLTKEGLRKVQGFLAAEGEVVVVGNPLDIAYQTPYETFLSGL